MTTIPVQTVKDQELMPFGLVESANESKEKNDFINIFICHLIFYTVLCIVLVLHILIDLGLGSFVKNQFLKLIDMATNTVVEKYPSFA